MKLSKSFCLLIIFALLLGFLSPAIAEDAKAEAPKAKTEDVPPPSIQTDQPVFIPLSSKVPFKFYGFISAEFMWADSQLSSFGTLNNTPANYNRNMVAFDRVVDETTDRRNDAFISATVQNTRFGFVLDPYDFNGKKISADARLEMDFFSTANMSIHSVTPRIRRAYAAIGQKDWRVLFGQEWDLYSPLNTATLNLGSNLWLQGNQGNRRPQIRFTYAHPVGAKSGLEGVASVNLPCTSMSFDCNGNTTCVPMEQARVGFWHDMKAGKLWAYLSGAYGRHRRDVAGLDDINNWALAASLEVPFHRYLQFSGELQYGYSFGQLLSLSSERQRQRFVAGWGQIKSQWLDWLETNIGYGIEALDKPQVTTGYVNRNQVGFANILFKPLKVFVIGIEYNYLRTAYKGSPGASPASAILSNTLFYF